MIDEKLNPFFQSIHEFFELGFADSMGVGDEDQLIIGRNTVLFHKKCAARPSFKIHLVELEISKCTDHRIGLTLHRLETILQGDIDEIIGALTTHYQAEKLKEAEAAPVQS